METEGVKIDIEVAGAYLLEKEKIRQQKHREEFEQTIKIIRDLANLWEKYNVERVYLYGSIARLKTHNHSDIDIALEGDIDYRQLLRLYGEVDKHFSREIDIRILDELPFKDTIKEKGVMAYER